MRATASHALLVVVALCVFAPAPASAGDEVRRRGDCTGGPGDWDLRVRREDRTTLRVRFTIDDVPVGQLWQLFLSDNGTRIDSATKRSNDQHEVRIRTTTRNRSGTDRIAASGVNTATGTTCEGSVRY